MSRYITHNKKLSDCEDSVDLVFGRMAPLGDRGGPALLQLPPMLHRDDERLKRFLSWLPGDVRATVEFRHASWYDEAEFLILRDSGVALCVSDHHDAPSPWLVTADFAYVADMARADGTKGLRPGRAERLGRVDRRAIAGWPDSLQLLRQ